MGTTTDKLDYLLSTKGAIKTSLEKLVTVPEDATFRSYADLIDSIEVSSPDSLYLKTLNINDKVDTKYLDDVFNSEFFTSNTSISYIDDYYFDENVMIFLCSRSSDADIYIYVYKYNTESSKWEKTTYKDVSIYSYSKSIITRLGNGDYYIAINASPGASVVGTDVTVFYSSDNGTSWTKIANGFYSSGGVSYINHALNDTALICVCDGFGGDYPYKKETEYFICKDGKVTRTKSPTSICSYTNGNCYLDGDPLGYCVILYDNSYKPSKIVLADSFVEDTANWLTLSGVNANYTLNRVTKLGEGMYGFIFHYSSNYYYYENTKPNNFNNLKRVATIDSTLITYSNSGINVSMNSILGSSKTFKYKNVYFYIDIGSDENISLAISYDFKSWFVLLGRKEDNYNRSIYQNVVSCTIINNILYIYYDEFTYSSSSTHYIKSIKKCLWTSDGINFNKTDINCVVDNNNNNKTNDVCNFCGLYTEIQFKALAGELDTIVNSLNTAYLNGVNSI